MFAYRISNRLGRQGSILQWLTLAVALLSLVFGFWTVADAARPDFARAPIAAGSGAITPAGLFDALTGDNGDFELAIALPFMIALVVVQTRCCAPRLLFASHVVPIDTPPPRRLA